MIFLNFEQNPENLIHLTKSIETKLSIESYLKRNEREEYVELKKSTSNAFVAMFGTFSHKLYHGKHQNQFKKDKLSIKLKIKRIEY